LTASGRLPRLVSVCQVCRETRCGELQAMTIVNGVPDEGSYALGQAATEIRRLFLQARLHDDFTEHAPRPAGLEPGMRVLTWAVGLVTCRLP
jgi:hypothetical protein